MLQVFTLSLLSIYQHIQLIYHLLLSVLYLICFDLLPYFLFILKAEYSTDCFCLTNYYHYFFYLFLHSSIVLITLNYQNSLIKLAINLYPFYLDEQKKYFLISINHMLFILEHFILQQKVIILKPFLPYQIQNYQDTSLLSNSLQSQPLQHGFLLVLTPHQEFSYRKQHYYC